jgi:hypothetical protein
METVSTAGKLSQICPGKKYMEKRMLARWEDLVAKNRVINRERRGRREVRDTPVDTGISTLQRGDQRVWYGRMERGMRGHRPDQLC